MPEYVWSEDHTALTATRTCAHDASHAETETVSVTAEQTLDPTCVEAGQHTYTSAAFENEAFEAQTKTESDIPATGHTPVTIEGTPATCTEEGLTDYIFCDVCGEDLQNEEPIPPLGHTPYVSREAIAPTCEEEGCTEEISCEVCGEILTESESLPAIGHSWNAPVIAWTDNGSGCAFTFVCDHCEESVTQNPDIASEIITPATCTTDGVTQYTATVTFNGTEYSDVMTLTDLPALGHTEEVLPAVAPTDREAGLTEGLRCTVCGEILIAQQTVPALWSYTDDGMTVTAYNGTDTEVTIPAGVTALSNTLFKNNTSITKVHVPSEVTTIGTQTFYGATALTDVWLPDNIGSIGGQTFYKTNATIYASANGQTAKMLSYRSLSFTDGDWTLRYRVTSTTSTPTQFYIVKWLGNNTELDLSNILPNVSLTQILSKAFENHTELSRVTIPGTVTTIAADAFDNCSDGLVIASAHDAYARTWAGNNGFVWAHSTHTVVPLPGQPATCTESGLSDGQWCEQCGEIFEQRTEIPALGHDWSDATYTWADDNTSVTATRTCAHDASHVETETVSVTREITHPATCEDVGETTYTSEAFENSAFAIQTKAEDNIPALGHDWSEATYSWAEDNTSVTATRICAHDASHVETETVSATSQITHPATCEDIGETTYTSDAFGNAAFEIQTRTEDNIPALGHNWSDASYTWAEDKTSVTATRVCAHDASHVETETVSVTSAVTLAATCEDVGETTYTSDAFANGAFSVQTKTEADIPALGHDWGEVTYSWTENNTSVTATRICAHDASHVETEKVSATSQITHPATCEDIGETTYTSEAFENDAFTVQAKTEENIPALGHSWSEATYTWADDNSSVTATRACEHDASHVETETVNVTSSVTREATCEDIGETTYTTAAFENTAFEVQTKTEADIPALGHGWGEVTYSWTEDNTSVTATRTCAHDANHVETETVSVTSAITRAATCEGVGETTYTSDAFDNATFEIQTKAEENIPALGHDWGEATYTWAEDKASVTATRTCAHDASHVETETVNVTSSVTREATCEEAGETTYTSEAFANEAFTVQTKKEMNIPAIGHDWGEAAYTWADDNSSVTATRTCAHDASHVETETVSTTSAITREATCEEIGETTYISDAFANEAFSVQTKTKADIPALGHDWGEATYTWAADNTSVTATRTCAHDASHVETETVSATSAVTRAATCEEEGETTYTTAAFDNAAFEIQTRSEDNIPALGHVWGEATYSWSDDKASVTAARTCAHDATHVETETVNVTLTVLHSPTQADAGEYQLVSDSFTNTAFAAQSESGSIPALGSMNVLKLPAAMKKIESEAFANIACEAIILPEQCTSVGSKAFANCRGLRYVLVTSPDTAIAADAFDGCGLVIVDRNRLSGN